MVGEDVSKGLVVFIGGESRQINASINEGLICWGEDREGSIALEGFEQSGLNNCGDKCIVNPCVRRVGWDVFCAVCCGIERHGGHQ